MYCPMKGFGSLVAVVLVVTVLGVTPAWSLTILGDGSQTWDEKAGKVWLDFDQTYSLSLAKIWEKTGDTSFRLATRDEVETLLINATLSNIIGFLGFTDDYTVMKVIRANLDGYFTYFTLSSFSEVCEFNDPAVNFPNQYHSWIVRDMNSSAPVPVPEPATFGLLLTGLAGLAVLNRRRRKRN